MGYSPWGLKDLDMTEDKRKAHVGKTTTASFIVLCSLTERETPHNEDSPCKCNFSLAKT